VPIAPSKSTVRAPKASVSFDPPPRPVTFLQFQKIIARDGIRLHRKSRMLHRRTHIFVNGESYAPTAADRKMLRQLADHRQLAPALVTNASTDLLESLYQWYRDGWLDLSPR
jgi:50S ribosomal protein L16 3-hydroxylase